MIDIIPRLGRYDAIISFRISWMYKKKQINRTFDWRQTILKDENLWLYKSSLFLCRVSRWSIIKFSVKNHTISRIVSWLSRKMCGSPWARDNPENCRNRYRRCCKRATADDWLRLGSLPNWHTRLRPDNGIIDICPVSFHLYSLRSPMITRVPLKPGCLFFLFAPRVVPTVDSDTPVLVAEIKMKFANGQDPFFDICIDTVPRVTRPRDAKIIRANSWSDYACSRN